jgi:hypothetical protein
MMSTDDFFSDPAVVELPTEDEGYKYDANYHVRVLADTNDVRLIVRLNRRLSRLIELDLSMELDEINEFGYCLSIKDTKKLVAIRTLKKFVVRVLSLIDLAVNNGATLFIRIDEGKVLDESESKERKPLFANVASKDVRINTKLLMGVLKEMGAHRDLCVCVKVEG